MMFPSTRVLLIGLPTVLLVLIAIASYATTQAVWLSLPIPFAFSLFTILLPLLTGFSAQPIHSLLRSQPAGLARSRSTLYLVLLVAFQLIYETVIATTSLNYLVPSTTNTCGLELQWENLYRNKDETAIRRIQDRFNCCGLKTLTHMAWPFQSKDINAGACVEITRRTRPCAEPWRQAEQVNAGLFFTVASVIFITKLLATIMFFTTSSDVSKAAWFQSRPSKHLRSGRAEGRRHLLEGVDSAEQQEEYHDDVAPTANNTEAIAGNEDSRRPRIEPSNLLGTGREWQTEEELIT